MKIRMLTLCMIGAGLAVAGCSKKSEQPRPPEVGSTPAGKAVDAPLPVGKARGWFAISQFNQADQVVKKTFNFVSALSFLEWSNPAGNVPHFAIHTMLFDSPLSDANVKEVKETFAKTFMPYDTVIKNFDQRGIKAVVMTTYFKEKREDLSKDSVRIYQIRGKYTNADENPNKSADGIIQDVQKLDYVKQPGAHGQVGTYSIHVASVRRGSGQTWDLDIESPVFGGVFKLGGPSQGSGAVR